MRLFVAIRSFFRALFDREFARRLDLLLRGPGGEPPAAAAAAAPPPAAPAKPKVDKRSEAITLLAALQREGRLVDFLQEPLEAYTDAQVGAAARDVHRECGKTLRRMFALEPVLNEAEGAVVDVPPGYDTGVYRLTGNVTGGSPLRGTMLHHGWKATTCQVPEWSGTKTAASIVAPVEVEVK